jgi:murein DD-endopeptidase MepM/ murein hydrolase activator NlpD
MGLFSAIDVAKKDLITEASANINELIENDSDTIDNLSNASESNISLPILRIKPLENNNETITYSLPEKVGPEIKDDDFQGQFNITNKNAPNTSIKRNNFISKNNIKEQHVKKIIPLKRFASKGEFSKLNDDYLVKQNSSDVNDNKNNDKYDSFYINKTTSELNDFPQAPKLNKKAKNFRFIASVDNELILMENVFKVINVNINNADLVSVGDLLKNNANIDPDSDQFFTNLKERLNLLAIYKDALQFIPLKPPMEHYYVSSEYGKRKHPVTGKYRVHHGIDLAGTWQENISVSADGTVVFAGYHGSFGKVVRIKHSYGIMTTYGHLAKINVKKGDIVNEGQTIGKMGRTGRVVGAHLHYEISVNGKSQNPSTYIKIGRNLLSRTSLKSLAKIN